MLRHEPVLSAALSHFGLGDASRYAGWRHTVALLERATGQRSYDAAILARLNDENTDPRKLLGFMTAPEGRAFIATQRNPQRLVRAASRANAQARQFPGDPVLAPLSQGLEPLISAPARQDRPHPDIVCRCLSVLM